MITEDILNRLKESPRASLESVLATDARDWSTHPGDAWIWGIVFGWTGDSMREVSKLHGWKPETVARLRRLHKKFADAFPGHLNDKSPTAR